MDNFGNFEWYQISNEKVCQQSPLLADSYLLIAEPLFKCYGVIAWVTVPLAVKAYSQIDFTVPSEFNPVR